MDAFDDMILSHKTVVPVFFSPSLGGFEEASSHVGEPMWQGTVCSL